MCGIVGAVDVTGNAGIPPEIVRQMAHVIEHRGPDGDGFFTKPNVALGMRQLSIIDVEGGDQPIFNEDNSICILFNGEIYNYVELIPELERAGHHFRTRCDTETIIHLYEEYGLDLFKHLRGMYSFALWDDHKNRLVLAIDHVGIKPLYTCQVNGQLYFASEVKALFAAPEVPRGLNLAVLDTYLSFGYMIGTQTLFQGIDRLPPGHALVVENGSAKLIEHYRLQYAPDASMSAESAVGRIRDGLCEAVQLHLRSDVPLGLFLSGGIDSASMLALMSQQQQVKTFTVGYKTESPDNEFFQAQRIARHFKSDHHELLITADDWWKHLQSYVYHHDEPNANSSAVSLQALSEQTRKHVTVVLAGLGGDELFGGYPGHKFISRFIRQYPFWQRTIPENIRPLIHDKLFGLLEAQYPTMKRFRIIGALPPYLARGQSYTDTLDEGIRRMISFDGLVWSDTLRRDLYGTELASIYQSAQHKKVTFKAILRDSWMDDPYSTASALMIKTWLPGNGLLSFDKVTMAHSLEGRVPFFEPKLMALAQSIPEAIHTRGNKWVLRQAMADSLPEWALERPKQPFGTPILNWFDHELSGRIREVLMDSKSLNRGLFKEPALKSLLDDHFQRRSNHVEVVFRLLLLELWQRTYLDAA